MILTNEHNVPEALYNTIKKNIYKPTNEYTRVTELISPPLIKALTIKHWDEITVDASEFLWSVLGQAVHFILEGGTPESALGEERLEWEHPKFGMLTGKSDVYHDGEIQDWKVTSVFSFQLGLKKEWEAQLNVYKFLWEQNHFPVDRLTINAILRDQMRSKAKFDLTYPQIPFLSMSITTWKEEELYDYIMERFTIHSLTPIECTPYEKWEKPTTYAVKKKGNKKATRVLKTEQEAKTYIDNIKDEKIQALMEIEVRKGECTKCEGYCTPRKFCPYNIYNKKGEE